MTSESWKVAKQLGVEHKLKKVVFRKTKSKWGHCCQNGTIQYNWLAMMAPKDVINYLIVHECSHLTAHGPFKKILEYSRKCLPKIQGVTQLACRKRSSLLEPPIGILQQLVDCFFITVFDKQKIPYAVPQPAPTTFEFCFCPLFLPGKIPHPCNI